VTSKRTAIVMWACHHMPRCYISFEHGIMWTLQEPCISSVSSLMVETSRRWDKSRHGVPVSFRYVTGECQQIRWESIGQQAIHVQMNTIQRIVRNWALFILQIGLYGPLSEGYPLFKKCGLRRLQKAGKSREKAGIPSITTGFHRDLIRF
jgi:hypothetical protein